jgi:hypothetical protein
LTLKYFNYPHANQGHPHKLHVYTLSIHVSCPMFKHLLYFLGLLLSSVRSGTSSSGENSGAYISSAAASPSLTSVVPTPTKVSTRHALSITDEQGRSFIFYHSTFPVPGLNPAMWREDQNGQLILAGLNFCSGCLCYSFDHRHPVSFVNESKLQDASRGQQICNLMTSPSNMQAIAHRSNLLKSNNAEHTLTGGLMGMFGCEERIMRSFYEDDFKGAKNLEKLMISDFSADHHRDYYQRYLEQVEAFEEAGAFALKINEETKKTDRPAVQAELNRRARDVSSTIKCL